MFIKAGILRNFLKKCFLVFDYFVWMIFDPSKFVRIDDKKIKKILIVHLGAIGEILITTTLTRMLAEKYKCKIDYLLAKGQAGVLQNNPLVGKIHETNLNFRSMPASEKKQREKLQHSLEKEHYGLAIIISPASWRVALLCKKATIPYRIGGFGGLARFPTYFYTRKSFPLNGTHSMDKNLEIVKALGLRNKKPKTEMYLTQQERKTLAKKIPQAQLRKCIVVHPGFGPASAGDTSRLWDPQNYAEVIDMLTEKGYYVMLTGIKGELPIINAIYSRVKDKKKVLNTVDKLSFREFCALLSIAKAVLAPDTGAGHIAASLGTPVVNLLSRNPASEWGPIGDADKIVNIYFPIGYEISLQKPRFRKGGGMGRIKTSQVMGALKQVLKMKAAR